MTKLYIDDIRDPKGEGYIIKRSSDSAIRYMHEFGCPDYISFDHDLGGDDTAMEVVRWMIGADLNNEGKFIPDDFEFNVHSANICGKANIESLLNSYLKFRKDK